MCMIRLQYDRESCSVTSSSEVTDENHVIRYPPDPAECADADWDGAVT